jgi:hypothetical protein
LELIEGNRLKNERDQKRLEEAKSFCRNKHLAWFYSTKNQKNRKAFIYFMPNNTRLSLKKEGGDKKKMSGANSSKWMYMRTIADILKINKISPLTLRNFAYLADRRFSSLTQMPSALRISTVPLGDIVELQRQTKEVQNALSKNI